LVAVVPVGVVSDVLSFLRDFFLAIIPPFPSSSSTVPALRLHQELLFGW
jgi:hypothetical protein